MNMSFDDLREILDMAADVGFTDIENGHLVAKSWDATGRADLPWHAPIDVGGTYHEAVTALRLAAKKMLEIAHEQLVARGFEHELVEVDMLTPSGHSREAWRHVYRRGCTVVEADVSWSGTEIVWTRTLVVDGTTKIRCGISTDLILADLAWKS